MNTAAFAGVTPVLALHAPLSGTGRVISASSAKSPKRSTQPRIKDAAYEPHNAIDGWRAGRGFRRRRRFRLYWRFRGQGKETRGGRGKAGDVHSRCQGRRCQSAAPQKRPGDAEGDGKTAIAAEEEASNLTPAD